MTEAHEVHLIERVANAATTYGHISARPTSPCTIIDLTAGRVDAVSQLEREGENAPSSQIWLRGTDYASTIAEPSRQEYVRWVSDISEREILDGKSIKQWFTYNDEISLWWFTATAQKGQISSPFRWLFYAFALIDTLFERGQLAPGLAWHLWVPDDATGRVLRDYLGSRGEATIHSEQSSDQRENPLQWLSRRIVTPLLHVSRALQLARHTREQRQRLRGDRTSDEGRQRVLVATEYPRSWRPISEAERFDEDVDAFDFYLGTMPWALREEGLDVEWLRTASTVDQYETWERDGIARQNLRDSSAWATIDLRVAGDVLVNHFRWCRDFRRLFDGRRAGQFFRYRGVDMSHWIARDYTNICLGSGVAAMIKVEQYRSVVRARRPAAVLYRDEMFRSGRQLSAGMKGYTHLVGVQHGIINEEATVYCFDNRDVPTSAEHAGHIQHCPVPDTFAAFGEYTRELFERWNGYDPHRVVPIGGPRHDNLVRQLVPASQDRVAMRASIRAKLGIPADSNVVLLCTQRARDAGAWFDLVIRGLRSSGVDAYVAVKTHHYHGGEEEVRQVAANQAFEDYAIFSSDTYPLIASADVVVGGPSTIILEAYLLDRPAISISSSDAFETYPYRQERIGRLVSTVADMTAALEKSFQDENQTDDDFSRHRRIICARHLWNDDAGAGSRLATLIAQPETTMNHPECRRT